jgi:hypothetical protein
MSELWPRISDLRISFELLSRSNYRVRMLSDTGFRALMDLVTSCASRLVWTYSEPGDGSLPDDDEMLARITGLSRRRWARVRPDLEQFFLIKRGAWRLKEDWIAIDDRPIRFAIPERIQEQVLSRQGRVCTYCGDVSGPFDFDHIFPVSRGGKNDASNLTLACATCNRSKGGKTLREWCL